MIVPWEAISNPASTTLKVARRTAQRSHGTAVARLGGRTARTIRSVGVARDQHCLSSTPAKHTFAIRTNLTAPRLLIVPPLDRRSLVRATRSLCRIDGDLAKLVADDGLPPLWPRPTGFATLVRIVLEQQVSLASAASAYRRIQATTGRISPASILRAGDSGLREAGITRQKSAYLGDLAERVQNRSLDLRRLESASVDEVRQSLEQVKGIGRWTSDIYLLLALRRPDIWPTGDLALQISIRSIKGSQHESTEAQQRLATSWAPWRSAAVRILWNHYLRSQRHRRR